MTSSNTQLTDINYVRSDDVAVIRAIIEGWAIWRDTADWARLLEAWHPGGVMSSTWFQGTAEEFVRRCKIGWDAGAVAHHVLGNASIDIIEDRAVAQTRLLLCVRGLVDGVLCDCTCTGRFYDLFEKRDGRWGLVVRQPIYEKDRLDSVDPAALLKLDAVLLGRFPEGYRHLAYMQVKGGQTVFEQLPGLRGPAVERVYAMGKDWLAGLDPNPETY